MLPSQPRLLQSAGVAERQTCRLSFAIPLTGLQMLSKNIPPSCGVKRSTLSVKHRVKYFFGLSRKEMLFDRLCFPDSLGKKNSSLPHEGQDTEWMSSLMKQLVVDSY